MYSFPTLFLAPERVAKLPPFDLEKMTTEPSPKTPVGKGAA